MSDQLRFVTLRSGERVPALGQGTWHMGDDRRRSAEEAAALRLAIDLGMTLIDTAEMYGGGGAEEVIARAAHGVRDSLFIVSKLYPHSASRAGVVAACERSLKRLGTDRIDLYLLIGAARSRSPRPWRASSASSVTARSGTTGSATSTAPTWRNGWP